VNIKEYISSGIIESYVLGLASEPERMEFEKLCLQYPELAVARNEFEVKLEKQAFEKAITPPSFAKERFLTAIRGQESAEKEAKVVSMDIRPRSNNWLRYVAAASVILLLASAYFAYDLYSKNQELKNSYSRLQSKVDSISSVLATTKPGLNPNAAVVVSMTATKSPSSANIYWDTASNDVYLVVKNLPQLPSEKQYQLWAFIDGKPKNLGLFDWDNKNVILKMQNTQKAEAFAITIENRGNGDEPHGTVETIGKINL
jgi:anti-sigma-K factor RskA